MTAATTTATPQQTSPSARGWQRFRRNRLGFGSLIIFVTLFVLSLGAEFLSNDKPLVVRFEGQWYFPVVQTLPERCSAEISRRLRITWTLSSSNN